jgi:hypothetical protein
MESHTHPSVSAAAATAVSEVLDGGDLLIEILLRVGFPATLVRAALVCKRWLGHISDRAFLGRFRKLHPPRLLGFYIEDMALEDAPPSFVPVLPQPLSSPPSYPALDSTTFRRTMSISMNAGTAMSSSIGMTAKARTLLECTACCAIREAGSFPHHFQPMDSTSTTTTLISDRSFSKKMEMACPASTCMWSVP